MRRSPAGVRSHSMRRSLLSLLVSLAALPFGWPHHLLLGVSDSPGDASHLAQVGRVDARYQYLSGGVNTGHGWSDWNPNGTFASMYVEEAIAAHQIPVSTYCQLLQSSPASGSSEQQKDLSNLRNAATMRAYWADYELLLRRVASSAGEHLGVCQ